MNWERVGALMVTLWVGGLWLLGYWVVPTLFSIFSDAPSNAAAIAGHLFSTFSWLGVVCGTCLMLGLVYAFGMGVLALPLFWLILLMMFLNAVGHFAVHPMIASLREALAVDRFDAVLKQAFSYWHGAASILYLLQSLCGFAVVWRWPSDVLRKYGVYSTTSSSFSRGRRRR